MIPEYHQNIEDIIRSATAEQRILWQQIRLICGENAAVRQIHFNGASGGTEFATYTTGKLYYALKISFHGSGSPLANPGYIVRYNENNAITDYMQQNIMGWDVTAAAFRYIACSFTLENIYFSRLLLSTYSSICFSGFKITY